MRIGDHDETMERIRTREPARCAGDQALRPRRATVFGPENAPPLWCRLLVEGQCEGTTLVDEAKLVDRADAGDLGRADTLPAPASVARLGERCPRLVAEGDPADQLGQDIERRYL